MTAYGRAHKGTTSGHYLIEIHSVNRKSLDINMNLPREILELDISIRKRITEKVGRGSLFVRLTKEMQRGAGVEVPPIELLKQFQCEWKGAAKALGYPPEEAVPFSMIMNWAMSASATGGSLLDPTFKEEILSGVDEALASLLSMKEKEGEALIADILPRLKAVESFIEAIREASKDAPLRYQERLEKKLEELNAELGGDPDRIAREVVIFADRIDITEELTRLSSHVSQFREMIQEGKKRLGRELDFLTQEMNRETNTIAAKSQELTITNASLKVKSELEKIREQLQNIE